MATTLNCGAYVRVKTDSEFRPGQDGMVVVPSDGACVGLVFRFDRFGRHQADDGAVVTGLIEAWDLNELDLATVEH